MTSRDKSDQKRKTTVFTIGHSTRPASEFIEILKAYGIAKVIDIRTIPKSVHNPQFNADTLRESLAAAKIGYAHMKRLGGLRHALKDSPNTGWKNSSFRGFADYMQTEDFSESIDELIGEAQRGRIAIMCAEAVPWRCHRSLVADALFVRGIVVKHIMSAVAARDHTLTPWAKVKGREITYPAGPAAASSFTVRAQSPE